MLPDVFNVLNTSAVRAWVGTSPPRIYRHGYAPQDVAAPYVTWFVINGTPENHLDGTPPVDMVSIQVDSWSAKDGEGAQLVNMLADALRDAIEVDHYLTDFSIDGREPETGRFRISLTFTYWAARAA
jgi:hypothetical protein